MQWKKVRLGEIAEINISSVDKKTGDTETTVRLCNFVDVYRNWAITNDMEQHLMIATATQREKE